MVRLQHAVRLGVVDDDLPQLHAVRFGELDETEHVRESVRAAVAGASLVDADAALAAGAEQASGGELRVCATASRG